MLMLHVNWHCTHSLYLEAKLKSWIYEYVYLKLKIPNKFTDMTSQFQQ